MPYFDWTDDEHLLLLPRGMRDYEDLESVSARAEAQVIAHYTVSTISPQGLFGTFKYVSTFTNVPEGATEITDNRAVCLRGYAVDPLAATDALRDALKRAVAEQMRWLRARDAREADVMGESKGRASSIFTQSSGPPFHHTSSVVFQMALALAGLRVTVARPVIER